MLDDQFGTIERLHLATALRDITGRLTTIETALAKEGKPSPTSPRQFLVDVAKVIFGGWPAFGFLFLILFYQPLREALKSIPEKVRSADEIQVAGVSLKSTIRTEALRFGDYNLSETIPRLSSLAIEVLLQAPRGSSQSLVSYRQDSTGKNAEVIYLPSVLMITALTELQKAGLITITLSRSTEKTRVGRLETIDGAALTKTLADFRKVHSGKEDQVYNPDNRYDVKVGWIPAAPIPHGRLPQLSWELNSRGKHAASIIVRAIDAELGRSSSTPK